MSEASAGRSLLVDVAEAAHLAEGPEGVRRLLRTVLRRGPVPIRDVARDLGIPVPVIAAVRGELEGRGLLTRGAGIALTDAGVRIVETEVGLRCRRIFPTPLPETPLGLESVSEALEDFASHRPGVDQTLDQSHATCDTIVRRAVYLYENDAIEGRRVIFLGDDDLTSLAVALTARELGLGSHELSVAEVDTRLVSFINETASRESLPIEAIHHDLRSPLPDRMERTFDVFFTDPPYTLDGLGLFVARGTEALVPAVGKQAFICFGRRSPLETADAIDRILRSGLAPVEMLPTFNDYVGAQLLAGQSQMIRCVSTTAEPAAASGRYDGPMYTADFRRGRQRGRTP